MTDLARLSCHLSKLPADGSKGHLQSILGLPLGKVPPITSSFFCFFLPHGVIFLKFILTTLTFKDCIYIFFVISQT